MRIEPPTTESMFSLLQRLYPGAVLQEISLLYGSYSNATYKVVYSTIPGEPRQVVLRQYNPAGGSPAEKARLEYKTLDWMWGQGLPVAQPLLLDAEGTLLGSPCFIMCFLPGRQVMWPDNPPVDPIDWARKMAAMLARIHNTAKGQFPPFLHDNNQQALYFRRSGTIPAYLSQDLDGPAIWEAIHHYMPVFDPSKNVLVHLDYWAGNVLWENGEISGVVDWEEAGYGEPGVDMAYALMELALEDQQEAANAYANTYESVTGRRVDHLPFWKLAAAVRPIHRPEGWIDASPYQERLRRFVLHALQEIEQAGG